MDPRQGRLHQLLHWCRVELDDLLRPEGVRGGKSHLRATRRMLMLSFAYSTELRTRGC